MLDWLSHAVLGFVSQYGYVAVFVYMVLETSFILHFVPSEVVVPFAASQLVHDGPSFVLFVADSTAGATVGSLLAYVLFGHYGGELLERYAHVFHVSEDRVERSQGLFVKYGESSVFWCRMLPFLRALISIPAGLAEMDVRRFVLYSAAGAAIFNTGLTYLVYTGRSVHSPLGLAVEAAQTLASGELAYVQTHTRLVLVGVGVVVLLAAALWSGRRWIAEHPDTAQLVALHLVRAVGVLVGSLFVLGALSSPHQAFSTVTWAWDDPLFFVHLGLSEQIALLLSGVLVVLVGLLVFELGQAVQATRLVAAGEAVRDQLKR